MPLARISLTPPFSLSLSLSLSFSLSLSIYIACSPSLNIRLYHPSLQSGLLDHILFPYRAVVDKFKWIVQPLHICVKWSLENITNGFVFTSLAVSRMSGSSYEDVFTDRR